MREKKVIKKFSSEPLGNFISFFVLLITVIATFVPFFPEMPASDLDSSWKLGMNQAVAQGFSFGKEIVFTFGPYASIYTKSYHPFTDFMMLGGSLYLALSYWVCCVFLMKGTQWRWVLAFCVVLAGFMSSRDALLFSLPLAVGLLTYKILISEEVGVTKSKWGPIYVALLFAPFGLLPLIKGSIFALCGPVAILCCALFLIHKCRLLAIICLFSPIVSLLFFWHTSGQSLENLPSYFINMAPIISGYTEAMASRGNIAEVIFYLLASAFLLVAIFIKKSIPITSKIFVFSLYSLFLFLSFKAGFVRHDGHALISGTSILIAAFLLPFIVNSWVIPAVVISSLILWVYIAGNYTTTPIENIANNFRSTYSSAWHGIKNRTQNSDWLKLEFDKAISSLRQEASFPVLQGTTDIYSYSQSSLIASGNVWSPRPILQSYSAYTPALAEINRKHLLGNQRPDNIIFKVEPIDGRIPSIEDGSSWPLIMLGYQPTRLEKGFLFLQKKKGISDSHGQLDLKSEVHALGESVLVPQSNRPIFARIEIEPTILGRIASILFRPSQLQIAVELNNGIKKQYRMIAGMGKSGFVISPLIEDTAEFGMLYGKEGLLDGKLVKSIEIVPGSSKPLWKDKYVITFSEIKLNPPLDVSKIYRFNEFDDQLPDSGILEAEKCEGVIDTINGITPMPEKISIANLLAVSGWLTVSIDQAILPEAVYVVLTDAYGKHNYLRTSVSPRPDVGAYFKKPELGNSGYSTMADISALNGQYTLGLAIKQSNVIKMCPQFKIPTTIARAIHLVKE